MHDAELGLLYVAVGEPGVVCTFETDGDVRHRETIETESGAHTLGLDPLSHHLYVFCPGAGGAAVYSPG